MRRLILVMIIAVGIFTVGVKPSLAAPPCARGPYTPPSTPCYSIVFGPRELVYLDIHVPFVWLRSQPASNASIVDTIRAPGKYGLLRTTSFYGSWDGHQWWWKVEVTANPSIQGWIEQASIGTSGEGQIATRSDGKQTSTQSNNWQPFTTMRIRSSVPFVWIRYLPGSPKILATIGPRDRFITWGEFVYPFFDGVQWWWPVHAELGGGVQNGWVEQNAITPG